MNLNQHPSNFTHQQVAELCGMYAMTAAGLAQELNKQTYGLMDFPEETFPVLVEDFRAMMAKQIMRPKTREEVSVLREKYISEMLTKSFPEGSEERKILDAEKAKRELLTKQD